MYSNNYKLISWFEDSWIANQENNSEYSSAKVEMDIAAEFGFKPLGQPTCAFVQKEQGMRVYYAQAFYRESYAPAKTIGSANLITPHTKKGRALIVKGTKETLKALTSKNKKAPKSKKR